MRLRGDSLLKHAFRLGSFVALAFVVSACASAAKDSHDSTTPPHDGPLVIDGADGAPGLESNKPPSIIYVSTTGHDNDTCGTHPSNPCKTISRGISRSATFGPPLPVHVAAGTYFESVELSDDVDVLGGYTQDFSDGPGKKATIIQGDLLSGQAIAVRADTIAHQTEFAHFTIRAANAEDESASSYGVLVGDSPDLILNHLTITAGNGVAGRASVAGGAGTNGVPGDKGINGVNPLFPIIPPLLCHSAASGTTGFYGEGGKSTCGEPGGRGGRGEYLILIGSCNGEDGVAGHGASGVTAVCDATTAGRAGTGSKSVEESNCSGTPTGGPTTDGTAGCPGSGGPSGGPAKTGSSIGTVGSGGLYVGAAGEDGVPGTSGHGGGGGGGAGYFSGCSGMPIWGGGGGGGGAGGCGGLGGHGGGGGGGSFGVLITKGYSTIRVVDCVITTGAGGAGGSGGKGGVGGAGGPGGAKASHGGGGGSGASGGLGGDGGPGGGGAGGPSIGVFVAQGTLPATNGTTFKLGAPGAGGKGATGAPDGIKGTAEKTLVAPPKS